jgi:hypothetical protein
MEVYHLNPSLESYLGVKGRSRMRVLARCRRVAMAQAPQHDAVDAVDYKQLPRRMLNTSHRPENTQNQMG